MLCNIYKITDNNVVAFAAEELKKYLRMMMTEKGDILIKSSYGNTDVDGFKLGLMEDFGLDVSEAEDVVLDDILHIDTTENGGIIAGSNPRSVLMAVYRFLEENGCRWLYPGIDGEYIPMQDIKSVKYHKMADQRIRGVCNEGAESQQCMMEIIDFCPKVGMNFLSIEFDNPFVYYDRYYTHMTNTKNRLNEKVPYEVTKQWKRQCECEVDKRGMLVSDMGHGWTADPFGLFSADAWVKDQNVPIPEDKKEYIALIDGERKLFGGVPLNTNVCMSNPKARKIMVDAIANYAENHSNISYIAIALADGINSQCECEECQKMRPSDWLVTILNEADEELTRRNLDSRLSFAVYVDTMWAPEKVKIKNPKRFALSFAPIDRPYLSSINASSPKGKVEPFVRNKLDLPRKIEDTVAHLDEWRKDYKGPCFTFEYHFWINQYYDVGGFYFANRISEDIKGLAELGLQGMVDDSSQRSFFPNGLGLTVYAKTLFDTSVAVEDIIDDYFKAAYGKHADFAKKYLSTLTDLFDFKYMRGFASEDMSISKFYAPSHAPALKEAAKISREAREYLKANYIMPMRAQTLSMKMLLYYTEYAEMLAEGMYNKAIGTPKEECVAMFNEMFEKFGKYEVELDLYYDQMMAYYALHRVFTEKPCSSTELE